MIKKKNNLLGKGNNPDVEFIERNAVPNFLGIGAQKSGTTWLYENLRRHPDVYFPGGEMHFWDMFYDKGIDWYKSNFPHLNKVQGEITPAYAILPVDKIQEIYDLNPKMKLIYSLRNPIDRAWSAALMEMERAGYNYENAPDEWFIEEFHSEASLSRGDYIACIKNWLSVFPEEQLLIMRFDDITRDPKSYLRKCSHHIGVDSVFFETVEFDKINKPVRVGLGHPIKMNLLDVLNDIYAEKLIEIEYFISTGEFA